MTPKRKMADTKIIFGDGILSGETLLQRLNVVDTCKLVLDHHHLLSEDIGAWPKEFGLQLWATLKADLTMMVKTHDATIYTQALMRAQAAVASSAKFSLYIENNIHAKRHLFANYIIKTYPCNMNLQGNAPAEGNHSSIVQRLGNLVVSPVELIRALIKRHGDISSERSHTIQCHHFRSMADALGETDESKKLALCALGKWGLELYRKASRKAKHLVHTVNPDGSHSLTAGDDGSNTITLPSDSVSCGCSVWTAFNGTQCCHLLVWLPWWLFR
jgi:hypothetical protein